MTKAEAIAMLKRIQEPEAWEPQINQAAFEALDMAIKALEQEPCEDTISRQAAIDYVDDVPYIKDHPNIALLWKAWVEQLPSAQPERMTNRQWVDFLSAQFDISRTSAKEMLHVMMRWKKEDNFKKMFNGGKP